MTDHTPRFSRRAVLQMGGAASLIGLLAACGQKAANEAPGRIGRAPTITEPEAIVIDDALVLRTMTSVELTAVEVIRRTLCLGPLEGDQAALVEQLSANHQANAQALADATTQLGAEPYLCPNAWLMERTWQAVMEQIEGKAAPETAGTESPETTADPGVTTTLPEGAIAPSDNPQRDALYVIGNLESITAASYQQLLVLVTDGALRTQMMTIAGTEARQAAAVAIASTGSPEGWIAPSLLGLTSGGVDEDGFTLQYGLPTQFGSLAPVVFNVGAAGAGDIRKSFTLYTPADNTYITPHMTCDAGTTASSVPAGSCDN